MLSRYSLIVIFLVASGVTLLAQENFVKNGDFEMLQTFGVGDYATGWVAHIAEPTEDEWLKTVDTGDLGTGVEITSGPPLRYLLQDVFLQPGHPVYYTLRCQAKGVGEALVSILPRERPDGGQLETTRLEIPLTDTFQTYEMPVEIPEVAAVVRINLVAKDEGSVVVFDSVELIAD